MTILNWLAWSRTSNPTWNILMKDVDLGERASFLDHVYLGCTQRECQIGKDIVDNYRSMFESRISAGAPEKYQKQKSRRNLMPKRYLHGPMIWKVMQRNAWKDIANLRIKQLNNSIWENPIEARLGEGTKLGMSVRTPWKRIILVCVRGWHQIGWKETKHWSDVESTKQRSWFGRTNIIPWPCIPGMYSKTMWNKQRYCWQLPNHVWIQNFRRSNWKITMLGKSEYLFVNLWHGR